LKHKILIILLILLNYNESKAQSKSVYCQLNELHINVKGDKKQVISTPYEKIVEYFPLTNTPDKSYAIPNINVRFTKIEKSIFLDLEIIFDHYHISNNPGLLLDKSQMIIHFINGQNIILLNVNVARGSKVEDQLIYKSSFFIPREDYKLLRKYDVDYISLNWNKEGATYEVYQVDLLGVLMNCILNN